MFAGPAISGRQTGLEAAAAALTGLAGDLHEADADKLVELLGQVDRVATLAAAARVAITSEAVTRGEVASSQEVRVTAWLGAHAPSLRADGAGKVAACVDVLRRPELVVLRDAVADGSATVGLALVVAREHDRLVDRVIPEALPTILAGLLEVGAAYGVGAVRELRARMLASWGRDGELQAEQDGKARFVELSHPVDDDGVFVYRLALDAAGKAILEAAVGPLAAPFPAASGIRDLRSSSQRRGAALVSVCQRATSAGNQHGTGVKTSLFLTMPLADLIQGIGAAATVGGTSNGALLAPETVRRLACDAEVIPVVLGTDSEVLDLGRRRRLFSPGQLRALWLRDRHCTFPNCTIPPHWCDAHHLRHWADGGTTDLGNAALLCARHHTLVHNQRLIARVTVRAVEWDRVPGSYDRRPADGVGPPDTGPPPLRPAA